MKKSNRFLSIITVILCCLVLVLSILGFFGTWIISQAVSNTVVAVLNGVEQTAGALDSGLTRVDSQLTRIEGLTSSFTLAAAQISRNVEDKGLLLVLLPEQKEAELMATAQSVRDILETIKAGMAGVMKVYTTIDKLPFINLPKVEEATLQKATDGASKLITKIENLRDQISQIRAGMVEGIDRVTEFLSQLDADLREIQDLVNKAQLQLRSIEQTAIQLQDVVPTFFTILAILLTLLLLWIAYTQVVVIRLAWSNLKQPSEKVAASAPAEILPAPEAAKEIKVETEGEAPEASEASEEIRGEP